MVRTQLWDNWLALLKKVGSWAGTSLPSVPQANDTIATECPDPDRYPFYYLPQYLAQVNMPGAPSLLAERLAGLPPGFFESELLRNALHLARQFVGAVSGRGAFDRMLEGPITLETQNALLWLESLPAGVLLATYRDALDGRTEVFFKRGSELAHLSHLLLYRICYGLVPSHSITFYPYYFAYHCTEGHDKGFLPLPSDKLKILAQLVVDHGAIFDTIRTRTITDRNWKYDITSFESILTLFQSDLRCVYEQGFVEIISLCILSDETLRKCSRDPKMRRKLDIKCIWRAIDECEERIGDFDEATRRQKGILRQLV